MTMNKYASYPIGILDEEDAVNHVVALYTAVQQYAPFVTCTNELMELKALGFNAYGIHHMIYQVWEFLSADSTPPERLRGKKWGRCTIN